LKDLNRNDGVTIVMVTHNLELANGTDRVLKMARDAAKKSRRRPPFRPRMMAMAG